MRARLIPVMVSLLIAACSMPVIDRDVVYTTVAPASASGPTVDVQEFELATDVTRYVADPEWLGVDVAQRTVAHLRATGWRAKASGLDDTATGDLIVRGRIVNADGGSETARKWAPGAGAARVGLEVEIANAAGEVLDRFALERHSGRSLDSLLVVEYCVDRLGLDIAQRVAAVTHR